jgi:hypothetical protein
MTTGRPALGRQEAQRPLQALAALLGHDAGGEGAHGREGEGPSRPRAEARDDEQEAEQGRERRAHHHRVDDERVQRHVADGVEHLNLPGRGRKRLTLV